MIYYKMIQIFDIYSFEWGVKLLTKGVLLLDKLNISHNFGWSAGGGAFFRCDLGIMTYQPRHLPLPGVVWSFFYLYVDLCSKWFEDPPQHPKKNGLAIGRVLVIQMIVWINRHGVIKMIRIWRVRDGPAPKGVYSERSISRWWFRFFKIYPYLETRSTGLKTTNQILDNHGTPKKKQLMLHHVTESYDSDT